MGVRAHHAAVPKSATMSVSQKNAQGREGGMNENRRKDVKARAEMGNMSE